MYDSNGVFVRSAKNEAGFERLDVRMGYRLFHNIYGGMVWYGIDHTSYLTLTSIAIASPVKFGAMPSLHVAWPAIIVVSQVYACMHVLTAHRCLGRGSVCGLLSFILLGFLGPRFIPTTTTVCMCMCVYVWI